MTSLLSGELASLLAGSQGRPFDVLCLGLNSLDRLCLVPGWPVRGGKLRMAEMAVSGGGQAATAACALVRLGHRVAYAGVCGDDEAGHQAGPMLAAFGVEPVGLKVKPGARSQQALILVEQGEAERTIIWYRDEACSLDPGDLDPGLIASCRVLHLDGHFPEASLAAARLAREAGAVVSLDGERIHPQTPELVSLCQVVVGCEDYAQRLTGEDDPRRALERLAEMGPLWAGRTLGPAGAEMLAQGRWRAQPGFAVAAVDSTGAGDVFHAGLIHALLRGQGPGPALATACAAAALSVTGLGGRSALPSREQTASLAGTSPAAGQS
jgi:sugar/nucleoside kinase (ribokinase family)